MTDPFVMRPSDFHEKGYVEFNAYGKHIGELISDSKKVKTVVNFFLNYRMFLRKIYAHISFIIEIVIETYALFF